MKRARSTLVRVAASLAVLATTGILMLAAWLYGVEGRVDPSAVNWSAVVTDRDHQDLHIFLANDERYRLKTSVAQIDPLYFKILMAHEDRRFYNHTGVDWLAMVRALWQLAANGRLVSGGSTLTMQTAKLLDPAPRTLVNKLKEMQRAITLERRYSKAQILALYAGITPYGGNVEGIEMGARTWFGKPPGRLTPAEAALLVALPQSPERLRPDRHPQQARRARNRILHVAHAAGVLSAEEVNAAMLSPIPRHKHPPPKIAPHLAWRVKAEGIRVQTTLELELQRTLERISRNILLHQRSNLAILVANGQSGEILGYVGSQNYYSTHRSGAFDYARAVRSPGSTLKPFIYGLAETRHLAHPSTLLSDLPTAFGGYRPENLDHQFHGEVTIANALRRSLNVPAVKVLNKITPARFTAALEQNGIQLENGEGLAIALGGAGLPFEKLVELYTALAGDGKVQPLRLRMDDLMRQPSRLLSASATQHLNWILASAGAPKSRMGSTQRARQIAFKTGTGPGGSDALAVGTDGRHVVGVWTGTIRGEPLAGNRGLEQAAPILYQVFDLLPQATLRQKRPGAAPPMLVRLKHRSQAAENRVIRILFPLSGSTIKLNKRRTQLPLNIQGATYPIVRLINDSSMKIINRTAENGMDIDQPGTYKVSLVDRNGVVGRSVFYVQ